MTTNDQVQAAARTFPNMAGKPDIDDALAAELEAAGIEVHRHDFLKNGKSEVDTRVIGGLHGWSFKRAWYYWRAEGPGIEVVAAEKLHASHGKDVRVAGHCGCPSPTEWYKGLAIGDYHVDSPAGLKALADTIKRLVDRAASRATPADPALDPATVEKIAADRADWLVDAVAGATQNLMFLRGEPEEDKFATEAILLNAKKAITVAISRALASGEERK